MQYNIAVGVGSKRSVDENGIMRLCATTMPSTATGKFLI